MSAEPAQNAERFQSVMDQMEANHLAALDATKIKLAEFAPHQGKEVGLDQAGNLPVGRTPNAAAKDLVFKYGREASPSVERTPAREPEP